jgi:ketosteroid isomerase-like protein
MSEEATTLDVVELVRDLYEAADRRDFDAAMSFVAPDAVLEARTLAERFEGRAAIRGFFADFRSMFETYEAKPDEILDLGHGVVFVANRLTARLPGSHAELRMRDGHVYEWEERMIVRITLDTDIDEARAAAERLAKERG